MSNFLLGTSTSAHQVEGNNIHSDYWAMENMKYTDFTDKSGAAVDHYNKYREDIALMKNAGLNAYRFSIEWARIEPEEGVFDDCEIDHYRNVIKCCRENGIEPVVTLHHFTSPKWLIEKGGWESPDVVNYFARYAKKIAEELGGELNYICTINEANMGIQVSAIAERYKAQMMARAKAASSVEGQAQVGMNFNTMMENMKNKAAENVTVFGTPTPQVFVSARTREGDLLVAKAHCAAREAIKNAAPHVKVGITLSLHDIQTVDGGEVNAEKEWNDEFSHYVPYIKDDDFIGVQNYTRSVIGEKGLIPATEDMRRTQMDYEFYPEALGHVIKRVYGELGLDVLVTENGIATSDDSERCEFIDRALAGVKECIDDEIPVLGYLHWSFCDNFEWQKGFSMTFGVVGVDRNTMERKPKASLARLGEYAKKFN
ncbi:MAG: family 1 glycosylhydrolase [Clostridia bacterium]|nr:family 1 glycosylhydrolase [Clostridia bacterium]